MTYKILGTDQKEYGPASFEQIVQWINEGRVDANTKAQAEGSTEWKPLSNFPEFAAALSAKAGRTPPPRVGGVDAQRYAADILARGGRIDAFHCVSRGWDLVVNNFWLIVGASFVLGLIEGAVPLLIGVTRGGFFLLALQLIRRQNAEFPDAFKGFSDLFLQLFLVGLISMLLTWVGFLIFILPGLYLMVAWGFAIPLVADKRLEFWPAMEVSMKVVNNNFWDFFLLLLVNLGVVILGLLVCCVGMYVAIPVVLCAIAYAYEDIFSTPNSPPTHPV